MEDVAWEASRVQLAQYIAAHQEFPRSDDADETVKRLVSHALPPQT